MSTVNLVKNKILYYDEALEVLDETINYKVPDTKGRVIDPRFKNYCAIDCEMVYVDRGDPPYGPADLSKPYPFKEKEFITYLNKLQAIPPTNKPGSDEATSLMEFCNFSIADVTIPKDIPGSRNARSRKITTLKTRLSRYVLKVARVTIVNWHGFVINDIFIPINDPVIWCPPSSGIPNNFYQLYNETPRPSTITIPGKIVNVEDDFDINFHVDQIYSRYFTRLSEPESPNIIIGHNLLGSDYFAMGFNERTVNEMMSITRDTAYLFGYEHFFLGEYKINSLKIKNLVKGFLKKDIQMGTGHDPSEDARGALAIYKLFRDGIESNTSLNITTPCPLYPQINDKHSNSNDPDATKLLKVVITDLLDNLSKIHNDTTITLSKDDVRNRYIGYIKYLIS